MSYSKNVRIGCAASGALVLGVLTAPYWSRKLWLVFGIEQNGVVSIVLSLLGASIVAGVACYAFFRNE